MEALRGEQRPRLVHASAPLTVDLLVMLTRFMLRGSGEGSFHISSTVQQVGEAYGVSAEVQAFPDSAVLPGDVLSVAILEVSVGRISAGVTRLGYALVQLFALSIGVVVGGIVTRTQPNALFQASVAPDFSGWVVAVGWLVFAIGMVWSFSLRWRDFGWMVLLIYLGFAVVEVGTALFGELAGTLLAGIAASFVVSLLTRAPTRPPYLVMILGVFFVLTVGAKGLRGLTWPRWARRCPWGCCSGTSWLPWCPTDGTSPDANRWTRPVPRLTPVADARVTSPFLHPLVGPA